MTFERLFPLTGSVLQRLRRNPGDLPAEILHPGERLHQPPVLMLPDEPDRIQRVQEETTPETERLRLAGGWRAHGPTRRLRLGSGLVTPFGIFGAGRALRRFGPAPWRAALTAPVARVGAGFAPLDAVALRYFGHLVHDGLPAALLAREGEALCLPVNQAWRHAGAYVARAGLTPVPAQMVAARELWLADDLGMNSHRRARMQALRDRLQAGLNPAGSAGVFLRRGDAGVARRLINEEALALALSARGFATCDLTVPLPDLLAALAGARLVVTVEGSHLVHAAFGAAPGATLVAINPADRFNAFFADIVPALGQRLATVLADPVEGGYRLDPDRLLRLLDLVARTPIPA